MKNYVASSLKVLGKDYVDLMKAYYGFYTKHWKAVAATTVIIIGAEIFIIEKDNICEAFKTKKELTEKEVEELMKGVKNVIKIDKKDLEKIDLENEK